MARQILIDTEVLPEAFRWTPTNPVRGTEEFYVRTAEELARHCHDVTVRYDGPEREHHGVLYVPRDTTPSADTLLACNQDPSAVPDSAAGTRIFWTNKYGVRSRDLNPLAMWDACVVISDFHRSTFLDGPGDPLAGQTFTIGHGVDPPALTVPKKRLALYSSSPDRGLEFLARIWPEVEKATGVPLVAPQGRASNAQMATLYAESQFWVHPGLGVELFCISALKAQANGCIPVVVPHMALAETVQTGVKCPAIFAYKDCLIETFNNPPPPTPFKAPTWAAVTAELASVLRGDLL